MSKSVEAPPIKVIKELSLPVYETEVLPNGMPLYMLKGGSEPVMRMENGRLRRAAALTRRLVS